MRPQCFLALLAVLVQFIAIVARSDSSVGALQQLQNLKSPHMQESAKFAVHHYNKQSGKDLRLEKVVKGETQIVAGVNYGLVIEVKNGATSERYQAQLSNHIATVKKFSGLPIEGINKMKSEPYTLETLRHENMVRLFDVYSGKGMYLLVYKCLENKSLADVLFVSNEVPQYDILKPSSAQNLCQNCLKPPHEDDGVGDQLQA
ncbi:hypothetical protein FEM48_Zijuj01G0081700 [Ziziphus jujuba var. spinosa]|uniref:Cystatin domain-containing protein n=1 Tax=Ziziphus jujuba var. spinosa TaxID=714518 RepID=A0A978W043_ZIZJJ|nr:hypothetical protein FEM48_Zijuj01G0081700 [Ziziphus jujuba var. spinosa]